MKFRKDINGLRAFAVLAVMIYHFKPEWVPGGFAGVDVFFVISGYLMTGIIFTAISSGNLNLLGFYVARINRIIPALIVLCTTLLIVGWFILVPVDYRTLGKHATSSLLFFSNVVYWLESGYFDVNSHEKLLLHTWSLSVEWQFYLIYPVLLLGLSKLINLNTVKKIIVFATFAFFFLNVFMTYRWPDAAYFLLPSRVWEMLLGGLAFLYPLKCSNNIKKGIEKFGLAFILLSFFLMDSHLAWPGYYALLPVIGAFLIIVGFQNS
ncbi:TPA: acyltransferase family protein, partial [Enterobacter cloacae]